MQLLRLAVFAVMTTYRATAAGLPTLSPFGHSTFEYLYSFPVVPARFDSLSTVEALDRSPPAGRFMLRVLFRASLA